MQNRELAGSVGVDGKGTGGRFAATLFAKGSDALDARKWTESSGASLNGRSPWDTIDWLDHMATGIDSVSTAGHGGIKLSPERNAAIPKEFRQDGGWYEEDCEAAIPMLFFADDLGYDDERKADLIGVVKNWFPEEYEAVTGEIIPPGESHTKDERTFEREHANDIVVYSAISNGDGTVRVSASRGGRRAWSLGADTYIYNVPSEEYEQRSQFGFIVDESRYEPVEITKSRTSKGIYE
jgi:hypothetical protein